MRRADGDYLFCRVCLTNHGPTPQRVGRVDRNWTKSGGGGGSTAAAVTLDTVADESRKMADGVARSPSRL